MIDGSRSNPRVLILGVAYKSGVADVRETPVSELQIHLIARGAIVAWHDPLVPIWEGSQSVDLDWDCDVAILATKQPGMDIEKLLARGVQVLDCTNSFKNSVGVTNL
jgi:UDP-N-acetyl-D-glucosamine dehydrogenase